MRAGSIPEIPKFKDKTEVILELYRGFYEGAPLGTDEFVICADEKPSIQCRRRQICPPRPGRHGKVRVESDYKRNGYFQYLLAWDVHKGIPMGRCEPRDGIAAFDRLLEQVMAQEPYRCAKRVFLIADQGSAHRGEKAKMRLAAKFPNLLLVHTAKHASWTSKAEIYFGIITRKLLTPAASRVKEDIIERLHRYEERWRRNPRPFRWRFTRQEFLRRLAELQAAAA